MRQEGSIASKKLDGTLYIHRKMIPLEEIDLDEPDDQGKLDFDSLFVDCEGICSH